mmetsp:Transcript_21852/g.50409  ORF Transcript_21852/g.50409 Transcript_21852/m.50409 type:complete len:105 (+) Transcript_21852:159-473(+)
MGRSREDDLNLTDVTFPFPIKLLPVCNNNTISLTLVQILLGIQKKKRDDSPQLVFPNTHTSSVVVADDNSGGIMYFPNQPKKVTKQPHSIQPHNNRHPLSTSVQ